MAEKILIIDDDANLLKILEYNLAQEDYQIITACDGREGMRRVYADRPDLLILDILMPELDGWQVCQRVREMSDVPIIMLTAKKQSKDVVKGLDLGADDYIVKPFTAKELLARVRAALRRSRTQVDARSFSSKETVYRDGYLSIDFRSQSVTVDGEPVKLTPTEYKLLVLLVENEGRVLRSEAILEKVWGFEFADEVSYLHTYVWRLRRKIEPDPQNPRYLLSSKDVGYRFEPLR